jgi:predicted permease
MNKLRTFWSRIRSLTQARTAKQDIDEELRFHLDQRTAENIVAGMSPENAAREARKRFGNVQSIREECRDARAADFGENVLRDVRIGIRLLRKNPGFATIAVLTLALGIGATSSVFSLVQGVLLTPPSYPKPNRIVLIQPERVDVKRYAGGCSTSQWLEWRNATNCFESIAGYEWGFQYLIRNDGSQFVGGLFVTPDYFKVIGVEPILGRAFSEADMAARGGDETTIILGYDLWQREFHDDQNILGKVIHLSRRQPLTVIGVMPPGVRFLPSADRDAAPNYDVNARVDFWMPLWPPNLTEPQARYCNMVARLSDLKTPAQAQAELTTISSRQARLDTAYRGITARVEPLISYLNRPGGRIVLPLMGAAALVFFIACANVAGLLLARGLQRQREYALRSALGAQRVTLFRQVLTESLLLSLSGGVLGIGFAMGIVSALKTIGGHAIPRLDSVSIGGPVLVFCLAAAVTASVIAGLVPAYHAAHSNSTESLKGTRTSSIGRTERRWLGSVATAQIALTLALLVGAGLLTRTAISLARLRPGYETRNILTMNVTIPELGKSDDFNARTLAAVSKLPGVQHVAFGWGVPLTGNSWNNTIKLQTPSDDDRTGETTLSISTRSVTADYFDALGLRILTGRGFRASDAWYGPEGVTNSPFVVIINEALEKELFGNQNPLGRKIQFTDTGVSRKTAEVIGVLADAREASLMQQPHPEAYFSMGQLDAFTKHLVIRVAAIPGSLIPTVQRELRAIEPTVAIDHVETLQQIRANSIAAQTFAMRLLVTFSLVGTILSLVGIYGVLSLSVGSRKSEIAIRMAVGAQRKNVIGLVLSEGLKLIVIGLLIGTGISIALGQLLRAFLFDVEPTDPFTFLVVIGLFAVVALLACFVPAFRATRIDPMAALHSE